MKNLLKIQLGNPILRVKAKKVPLKFLKTSKGKKLIKEMIYRMRKSDGVGLAAPQINHSIQLAVLETRPVKNRPNLKQKGPIVIANPKIIRYSKEKISDWEGCLSWEGICAKVPRSKNITVTYFNVEGKKVKELASDFWARIFQHEIDHLNGIMYIDRVEDTKTIMTLAEFKKRLLKKKKKVKIKKKIKNK